MDIHVVEDDTHFLNRLQREILAIIEAQSLECRLVTVSSSGMQILEEIDWSAENLFFLDIELGGMITGVHLAMRIRKYDSRAKIVFLSGHPEFAFSIFQYRIEVMDYIIKGADDIPGRIQKCIETAVLRFQQTKDEEAMLVFWRNSQEIRVGVKDLYSIETTKVPNCLSVHARNRHFDYWGSLSEFEDAHPDLIRCHKSFIVNMQHIIAIDKGSRSAILKNQGRVLISRRMWKVVEQKFIASR